MIIKTNPYNLEEVVKILALRASTESIKLSGDALAVLGKIGADCSLRFAV